MGKKQKRGKAGNAAQYLTRNQAIKKLQLRLSEFRRLCILKGVHPREPRRKPRGAHRTYYHVKDINWLAHEPLIASFRAVKVHERRVAKARAKQNLSLARRLLAAKPGYQLDHLVRERYPSFVDALRDLDDPLTLVHLFATLPGEGRLGISPATVAKCRRLVLEWNAYVARTHALRKVFVSVKGFYYQAEVAGCPVTWLVPHQLAQVLPSDVDFTVMLTFLEFYCTLLGFVMFKLYHNLGLRYPPVVDRRLEAAAAGLAAVMRDLAGLQEDQDSTRGGGAGQQQQLEQGGQQEQQQRQQQQEGEEAAAVPEVVSRLGSLGRKVAALRAEQRRLQQQQQQEGGSGGSDSEGELPAIDSGGSGSEEEEQEEEEEDSEEGASEEEQGEGDEGSSEQEQEEEDEDGASGSEEEDEEAGEGQQQQLAAEGGGAAPAAAAAGASVAGGGLGEVAADDDEALCGVLLRGLVFFLAREVPREPLLFIIRAFGGEAGWEGEGSPYAEADEAITHQVVDRPTQAHKFLSRAYVQPQWLFDSVNHRVMMPADLYAPGRPPPPHLSPFVDNEAEGYTPEFAAQVKQLQEAARAARRAAAGLAADAAFLQDGADAAAPAGAAAAAAGEDDAAAEAAYHRELAKELRAAGQREGGGSGSDGSGSDDDGSGSDDDGSGSDGGDGSDGDGEPQRPRRRQQQQQQQGGAEGAEGAEEEAGLATIMMTRKTRKFYGRINRAIQGKAERVAALEQRKRALDAADGGAGGDQQQQQRQGAAGGGKQKKKQRAGK